MTKEKRKLHRSFKITEAENTLIRQKMEKVGIKNQSMYFRTMALNGYLLKVDLPEIRELVRLTHNLTNNVNQIAKRLNEHDSIYETEIDDIRQRLDELWALLSDVLKQMNALSS